MSLADLKAREKDLLKKVSEKRKELKTADDELKKVRRMISQMQQMFPGKGI